MSDQTIKIVREIFELFTGSSIETTKDSLLIKVDKDIFIKKILAHTHIHELGFEYTVDDKYIVFKMPIVRYGKEVLEQLGIPI